MRSLVRCLAAGLLVAGTLSAPSAQTRVVTFLIDDTFPASAGPGVFSDADVSGTNWYADYRIDPAPPLNWCVDAEPYSAGNLFVRLNRKLDGDAGTMRCTEHPNQTDGELGKQRNFVLRIASKQACDYLSDDAAGLPLVDAAGFPWNPESSSGLCVLAQNDNPRVRLGTLYKARAKSTSLDFLTVTFDAANSYEIRSVSAASITSEHGPNHKRVAYTGNFQLVKFQPGKKAVNVGQPFAMPVRMDFYQQ